MGCLIRRDYDSNGNLKPHHRCRKWELQVSINKDSDYSKRSMRFSGTQREAKAELARFEVEVENEIPSSGWTFEQYAASWFESRKGTVSKSTQTNDKYVIECANEAFGNVALEKIGESQLNDFKDILADRYSSSGQYTYWVIASSIFKKAVKDRLIPVNPMQYVDAPKKKKRVQASPSKDDLLKLLSQLEPRKGGFHLAIVILIFTGIRRGECAGLLWSDVRDGGISVTKQYGKNSTKTGNDRFVPLPRSVYAMLDDMRGDDNEQVISRAGLKISSNYVSTWWQANRDKFGMNGVRLHDLRHAYLTLLQESGVPVSVAQALAGHSTSKMTLDVYTHPHENVIRKAVNETFDEQFAANLR